MRWRRYFNMITSIWCLTMSPAKAFADEAPIIKPDWVKTMRPPNRIGKRCYLGSTTSVESREKALDESYKNALIEIVRREFPELVHIKEKSSESLRGSTYVRDTIFQSDKVQFFGLEEDRESPFVEENKSGGSDAYRLLCWPTGAIDVERKRQAEAERALNIAPSNHFNNVLPVGASGRSIGRLDVLTSPPGATILLEASPIGFSNAVFEKVVAGSYEIVLQKEGYDIKREEITITPGKTTKLHSELSKGKSTLVVDSTPDGARVYIDNKPFETKTPARIPREVGDKVQIRVEMDDYETEYRTVELVGPLRQESFSMKMMSGRVSVLSSPSKASILIDQELKGKTPSYNFRLSGGEHKLQLTLDGFNDYDETINVKASKPITVTAQLTPFSLAKEKTAPRASYYGNNEPFLHNPQVDKPHVTTVQPIDDDKTDGQKQETDRDRKKKIWGWTFIGESAVLGYVSYYYNAKSSTAYTKYKSAKDTDTAVSARNETQQYSDKRDEYLYYSGILLGTGVIILKVDF